MVEGRFGIAIIRVADVRTLGIENHRHCRRRIPDVLNRGAERLPPLVAVRFIKCGVGLESTHEVFCRIHYRTIECHDGLTHARLSYRLGNLLKIGIEPYTEEFALLPLSFQE